MLKYAPQDQPDGKKGKTVMWFIGTYSFQLGGCTEPENEDEAPFTA
jgi:hypothetical protein